MGTAHGGQVVTSTVTAELAREAGFELRDLGEHRLAGLSRPERVWQLSADGLADDFPPLRSVDSLPGNVPRQVTSFVGRDGELGDMHIEVGVDATRDLCSHVRVFFLRQPDTEDTRPAGTADKTTTSLCDRLLVGHSARPVGVG